MASHSSKCRAMPTPPTDPPYPVILTDLQLTKLGRFIVIWNMAEMLIHTTVHYLLKTTDKTGEIIMGSPSVGAKIEIYLAVCSEFLSNDEKALAVALSAASDITNLVAYRNDMAHAKWGAGTDYARPSRKLYRGAPKVEISDIDDKTEALCITTNKLAYVQWHAMKTSIPGLSLDRALPWQRKFEMPEPPDPHRKGVHRKSHKSEDERPPGSSQASPKRPQKLSSAQKRALREKG
jgi:hypothetical protein